MIHVIIHMLLVACKCLFNLNKRCAVIYLCYTVREVQENVGKLHLVCIQHVWISLKRKRRHFEVVLSLAAPKVATWQLSVQPMKFRCIRYRKCHQNDNTFVSVSPFHIRGVIYRKWLIAISSVCYHLQSRICELLQCKYHVYIYIYIYIYDYSK